MVLVAIATKLSFFIPDLRGGAGNYTTDRMASVVKSWFTLFIKFAEEEYTRAAIVDPRAFVTVNKIKKGWGFV